VLPSLRSNWSSQPDQMPRVLEIAIQTAISAPRRLGGGDSRSVPVYGRLPETEGARAALHFPKAGD